MKNQNNNSKNFQIKNEGIDFNIKISYISNSLIIKVKNKDNDMLSHIYSFEKTMDELKKYHRFFKMYENIKDAFKGLCDLIESKSSILQDKDTNKIVLIIPFNILKIKEIKFELNENNKNENEKIEELFSIISNLKKSNENKEKEINELKSIINELKKDITQIKQNKVKEKEKEELKNIIK